MINGIKTGANLLVLHELFFITLGCLLLFPFMAVVSSTAIESNSELSSTALEAYIY